MVPIVQPMLRHLACKATTTGEPSTAPRNTALHSPASIQFRSLCDTLSGDPGSCGVVAFELSEEQEESDPQSTSRGRDGESSWWVTVMVWVGMVWEGRIVLVYNPSGNGLSHGTKTNT